MRRIIKSKCKITDTGTEYWSSGSDPKGLMKPHRPNGLPAIVYLNGNESYYEYGLRHRVDGPAVVYYLEGVRKEEFWRRGVQHDFNQEHF